MSPKMNPQGGEGSAGLIKLLRLLVNSSQPQQPPPDQNKPLTNKEKESLEDVSDEPDNKGEGTSTEFRQAGSDNLSVPAAERSDQDGFQGANESREEHLERQRVLGRLRQRKHQAKRREIKYAIEVKMGELYEMEKMNDRLRKKGRGLASILMVVHEEISLLKHIIVSSKDTIATEKDDEDDSKAVEGWIRDQSKQMDEGMFTRQCKELFTVPERIMVPIELVNWNIFQTVLGKLTDELVAALGQSGIHLDNLLHGPSLDRILSQRVCRYDTILEITRSIVILTMLYLASPGGSFHKMAETPVPRWYTNDIIASMCCLKGTQAIHIRNCFNSMVMTHAKSFQEMLFVLGNLPGAETRDVAPAVLAARASIHLLDAQTTVFNIEKTIVDASIQYITDIAAELEPMQLAVLLAAARGFGDVSRVAAALSYGI